MLNLPEDVPLVALRRGDLVESFHRGRYVFCGPSGEILDSAGDPGAYAFSRSSLKPLQAMPLVLSGAADEFDLSDEEIAVSCGSHRGEERHVAVVRSLLRKAGLTEDDLDNGAHLPLDERAARRLIERGEEPRSIHGNCSGKHAGMVAVCRKMGWEVEGYRRVSHPLQSWIQALVAEVCGLRPEDLAVGGDGCGAPAFATPLASLATAFARLAIGEGLSDDLASAALRLRDAMRENPYFISGTGGFDTQVMEGSDLVVKGGADGFWAAGRDRGAADEGFGFALKISDGAQRAVRPAAVAALGTKGVEVGMGAATTVRDLHGAEVGEILPLL